MYYSQLSRNGLKSQLRCDCMDEWPRAVVQVKFSVCICISGCWVLKTRWRLYKRCSLIIHCNLKFNLMLRPRIKLNWYSAAKWVTANLVWWSNYLHAVTRHPVLIALLMQKDKPLPSMDNADVPLRDSLINKQSNMIARLGPRFDMTLVI